MIFLLKQRYFSRYQHKIVYVPENTVAFFALALLKNIAALMFLFFQLCAQDSEDTSHKIWYTLDFSGRRHRPFSSCITT